MGLLDKLFNTTLSNPYGSVDSEEDDTKSINDSMGFSDDQWSKFKDTIAKIESNNKYDIKGGANKHYDGKYQLGKDAKTDAASILGIKDPGHDEVSREKFRKDPDQQEKFFTAFTKKNHNYLMQFPEYKEANPERRLEILGYAHNQGMGGAAKWLKSGKVGSDAFGTKGTKYTEAVQKALKSKQIAKEEPSMISGILGKVNNLIGIPNTEASDIQPAPERKPASIPQQENKDMDLNDLLRKITGQDYPEEDSVDESGQEDVVLERGKNLIDKLPMSGTEQTASVTEQPLRDPFTESGPELREDTSLVQPREQSVEQSPVNKLLSIAAGQDAQDKSDLQKAIDERKEINRSSMMAEGIAKMVGGLAGLSSGYHTPVDADLSGMRKMGEAGVKDVELKRKAALKDRGSQESKAAAAMIAKQFGLDPKEVVGKVSAANIYELVPQLANMENQRKSQEFKRTQSELDRESREKIANLKKSKIVDKLSPYEEAKETALGKASVARMKDADDKIKSSDTFLEDVQVAQQLLPKTNTGPMAAAVRLRGYLSEDMENLQAAFDRIKVSVKTELFKGMSRAIDSDAEAKGLAGKTGDVGYDDLVNHRALIALNSVALKNSHVAKDFKNWVNAGNRAEKYKLPFDKLTHTTMVDETGNIKVIHNDNMENAKKVGYITFDDYSEQLTEGQPIKQQDEGLLDNPFFFTNEQKEMIRKVKATNPGASTDDIIMKLKEARRL